MEKIELKMTAKGRGFFVFKEDEESLGEMEIAISEKQIIVFHTEVVPKAEGKGIGKKLLNEMVVYARNNHLKVVVLCPYVLAQFKQHPEQYSDIWKNKNDGYKQNSQ